MRQLPGGGADAAVNLSLRLLRLSGNPLGDEGALVLAGPLASSPSLDALALSATGLTDDGSPPRPLEPLGAEALAPPPPPPPETPPAAPRAPPLRRPAAPACRRRRQRRTAAGVELVCAALELRGGARPMRMLDVSHAALGAAGAAALARAMAGAAARAAPALRGRGAELLDLRGCPAVRSRRVPRCPRAPRWHSRPPRRPRRPVPDPPPPPLVPARPCHVAA